MPDQARFTLALNNVAKHSEYIQHITQLTVVIHRGLLLAHPRSLWCTTYDKITLKVLVATIDAQWEGMGDVGLVRHKPALLPPCPTIRVLSFSN